MRKPELREWILERNAALSRLDMDYARKVMPDASCDEVRLVAMHKARYECLDLPDKIREDSGRWLREHRFHRMDGSDVLPEGMLPL